MRVCETCSNYLYPPKIYIFCRLLQKKSKYLSRGPEEEEGSISSSSIMFSPPHPNISLVFLFLVTMCSYHVFVGPLSASECWSAILVGWNDWDDPHVWVGAAGGCINRVSTNISTGKLCSKISPLIYCYLYIDEKQYDNSYIKLFCACLRKIVQMRLQMSYVSNMS